MSTTPGLCKVQLDLLLLGRDLDGWKGLPEGCSEDDLARWFSLRPGEGMVYLGSEMVAYRFRMADVQGLAEPVQLCFQGETLHLVRTGPWPADPAACRRLLQRLGEPDDRLDLVFGMGTIAAGEWVYAARGLAVGVVPETGVIVGVTGCRACDVATYRRCFHHCEPPREFRAPGPG
jgi:hypothetical protein